jgi:hypothetical protein
MRSFINRALVAIALALAVPLAPAVARAPSAAAVAYGTRPVTLLASAARTATATGSAVPTGYSNQPGYNITLGLSQEMLVFLNVTVATSGTLDLSIQGSFDNSTWYTMSPLIGSGSAAWNQVTTSTGAQARRFAGPLPTYVRALGTGASTPIHTYSVLAVLGGS